MMVWAVSLSSIDLSTDVLTAVVPLIVFVVCQGWVPVRAPVRNRALPLSAILHDASPKAVSRRTSYLQVRLAFHRYPQVFQANCSLQWFGPSRSFTCASTCPWIGHLVSGLPRATKFRPLKPRFHYAYTNWFKLAVTR